MRPVTKKAEQHMNHSLQTVNSTPEAINNNRYNRSFYNLKVNVNIYKTYVKNREVTRMNWFSRYSLFDATSARNASVTYTSAYMLPKHWSLWFLISRSHYTKWTSSGLCLMTLDPDQQEILYQKIQIRTMLDYTGCWWAENIIPK